MNLWTYFIFKVLEFSTLKLIAFSCSRRFRFYQQNKRILLTRPNALARAIAETLVVDARTVEIYELLASAEGIKVGFTIHAASSNSDDHLNYLLNRRHRKKLELLILKHWSLHRLPKCMMIHQGHRGTKTSNSNGVPPNKEGLPSDTLTLQNQMSRPMMHPEFDRNSSNFKMFKLHQMNTKRRLDVRNYDPQLTGLVMLDENIEISVSPSTPSQIEKEEETDWNHFVGELQEYAQTLAMMQRNTENQIDENMEYTNMEVDISGVVLDVDGDGNLTADELCEAYMQNIHGLLEDKMILAQAQRHRRYQSWNSVATNSDNFGQDSLGLSPGKNSIL